MVVMGCFGGRPRLKCFRWSGRIGLRYFFSQYSRNSLEKISFSRCFILESILFLKSVALNIYADRRNLSLICCICLSIAATLRSYRASALVFFSARVANSLSLPIRFANSSFGKSSGRLFWLTCFGNGCVHCGCAIFYLPHLSVSVFKIGLNTVSHSGDLVRYLNRLFGLNDLALR